MVQFLPALSVFCLMGSDPFESRFVQVAPLSRNEGDLHRSEGQTRAVVLIHGLILHPILKNQVNRAEFRPWQKSGSALVQTLAKDSDVYAFSYSPNIALTEVLRRSNLADHLSLLRQMGYEELVLVGHSAGGLICRQCVEDFPDLGVTKVIQVFTPNEGTSLARFKVIQTQEAILQSLTKNGRLHFLQSRQERKIPESIQFVCVVGNGLILGDGIVSTRSQWPEDLQRQGIPAVLLKAEHFGIFQTGKGIHTVARLVCDAQPRWASPEVASMRRILWGPFDKETKSKGIN